MILIGIAVVTLSVLDFACVGDAHESYEAAFVMKIPKIGLTQENTMDYYIRDWNEVSVPWTGASQCFARIARLLEDVGGPFPYVMSRVTARWESEQKLDEHGKEQILGN